MVGGRIGLIYTASGFTAPWLGRGIGQAHPVLLNHLSFLRKRLLRLSSNEISAQLNLSTEQPIVPYAVPQPSIPLLSHNCKHDEMIRFMPQPQD